MLLICPSRWGSLWNQAHHNLAFAVRTSPVTARRSRLAGHGSPDFHQTTTDAGGRFSKFASRFSSAAPVPIRAGWAFIQSAPPLTAAGNRSPKSGQHSAAAGSRNAQSWMSFAKSAGSLTKSAFCETYAGSCFAKSAMTFTKSADAFSVSEHAFPQSLASKVLVFTALTGLSADAADAGDYRRGKTKSADFSTLSPRFKPSTINHQLTTD